MVLRLAGRGESIEITERLRWSLLLPAVELQGLVHCHPDDPGAKTGLRAKCRETKPDLNEHLLEEIVPICPVPHHRSDTPPDGYQMPVHQDREAIGIAGQREFDKRLIFEGRERCIHSDVRGF
jgi:hypothetical protein